MITDILIMLVKTLIEKGFEFPIHIFMVSQNGNVVVAKYEGESKTHVLLEHIEDPDWKLPINSFFVDGKGESESITIPESFADTLV
ncbi:MAG TPA: hypothetical protein VFG06_09665 [Thermodesulfovibrionales bacterium]|nr:hypothetical protein [Thermodesulfovibrionales bacterium]